MSAFSAMVDDLFGDDNIALDAVYTPDGGDPVDVRVVPSQEDIISGFGPTRVKAEKALFDVRRSELPAPAAGAALEVDEVAYTVKAVRTDDPERLVWTLECTAAP